MAKLIHKQDTSTGFDDLGKVLYDELDSTTLTLLLAHSHASTDILDFVEAVQDIIESSTLLGKYSKTEVLTLPAILNGSNTTRILSAIVGTPFIPSNISTNEERQYIQIFINGVKLPYTAYTLTVGTGGEYNTVTLYRDGKTISAGVIVDGVGHDVLTTDLIEVTYNVSLL